MKKIFLTTSRPMLVSVIAAAFFFAAAGNVFALSYSPSTIYPGTPYTLSESVSNSSGSAVSVTKDCFWWKNDVYGGTWGHEVINVPNGGTTATCSSTGDTAGSAMRFQMNIWRPDYQGTYSISTASFTVQERPVASVSISGTSPVSYNGGTYLTVTPTNASSCSVSGGGNWVWLDSQYKWWTGNLISNTTFTASCVKNAAATGDPTASITIAVSPPPKSSQTITFAQPASPATYNTTFDVAPTASSGLTVSVAASGGCSLSGSTVTMTSGTTACTLTASQAGNTSYNAAPDVVRTVNAAKASQTISFGTLSDKAFGDAPFTVSATGGASGNSVTFSAPATSPANQCSVSGSTVTINGVGTCTIRASQAGNTNYNAAANVDQSFAVTNILHELTADISSGSGSITATGISCGTDCSESYTSGASVTLTASPASGWSVAPNQWSGCDATASGQGGQALCTVLMNEARSVSVYFNQLSASASFTNPADGLTLNYKSGTYLQWSSSNTTGCSISASPAISGYPKTGLPSSHSGNTYWSGNLEGNVALTLDCTPVLGAVGTPSSQVSIAVNPAPSGACVAEFNNHINMTTVNGVRAWRTTADGSVSNCPSSYFTNLNVSGTISLDGPGGPSPVEVFDFNLPEGSGGSYIPYDYSNCTYAIHAQSMQEGGGLTIYGGPTAKVCTGGGAGATLTGSLQFGKDIIGGLFSSWYENSITGNNTAGGFDDYLYPGYLPWGNYKVHTTNTFSGTYKCPDGDVQFDIPVSLIACALEPNETLGGVPETRYYDSKCVPLNPNRASQALNCPSAPVSVEIRPTIPSTPGTPIDFTHYLNVKSTVDGASSPGVLIEEHSVTPSSAVPVGAPNFGGTTNYERVSAQNVTVVLDAPSSHTLSGGSFDSWAECDSKSMGGRRCTVSFVFDALGGQTKTVTANYSSSLTAPVVLTSSASCDANGGKVNVYLQSAVSGATGYHIYRSTSPFTAARKNWTNIAHAQTAVELDSDNNPANGIQPFTIAPTQANPFVDAQGLVPNTTYYYRAVAFNSSVSSPASAQTSRAASLPCPDLVVEQNSVEIINSATSATISPTAVPSNTSIKFRAKIRNQGGETPTLPSPGFYNRFTVGTTELTPNPTILSLGQNTLSSFISSGIWLTPTPTTATNYSLQVCADHPLPDKIREVNAAGDAETNNCLTTPFSFSVVVPISVQLEVGPTLDATKFRDDYIIVDYEDAPKLRWKISGNPTTCAASANTDWTGSKVKDSYTVTNNPFSLGKLLSKLSFIYQLDCTR